MYYSYYNQADTQRKVEPIGLFYYRSGWHLIAFCRLRNDYRDFRIDRIKSMSSSHEVFNSDSRDSLQTYIHKLTQSTGMVTMLVRFDKEVVKYLYEQKFYYGFVSERELDTQVEMTFVTGYTEFFGRWLLMYGTSVEIIGPPELKKTMKELAQEIKSHYL
jgi:predicted DNA-binding transcriptional regulator YafY